ncbi:MAG: monooxygenase, FAD-binding [Modestobacter sp.]|jgi:anthraniloyl-CoA monooxygenase|nr:monooxygenase, FAD-binding [Modestobacter sp.]
MKTVCIGAGPAGLYTAICLKLAEPDHDITVLDGDPRGATYGWGVCFSDDVFDLLYANDRVSARTVRRASVRWQGQETHLDGGVSRMGGYGYAVLRASLLEALERRAIQLGVRVEHDHPVEDPTELADADLVVVADGAGSRVRQLYADAFGTRVETGHNPYIWLGTDTVFHGMVFAAEPTPTGWIWLHGYPSSRHVSTCVVECTEETWRWLGLDERDEEDGLHLLENLFRQVLEGRSLISQSRGEPARWLRFRDVTNDRWTHGNVVLIGDAAHTTHFTVGWGTKLALIDAVELVRSIRDYPHDLPAALRDFDERSRPFMRRVQSAARGSMAWYEHADDYLAGRTAVEAAYAMATRDSERPRRNVEHFQRKQRPPARWMRDARQTAERIRRAAQRGEYTLVPAWQRGPAPVTRPSPLREASQPAARQRPAGVGGGSSPRAS